MVYSSDAKYRGTKGTLTLERGVLTFSRLDGLISKITRIIISIPCEAIRDINVEGSMKKKLVLLVDSGKVPGIPRHEFEVSDAYRWKDMILTEMAAVQVAQSQQYPPQKEIYTKEITREIIKIPCKYCGMLNEITAEKCSGCGASVGGR